MSKEKVDFMEDEESHPLALPYIKTHRHVTELFIKERVSGSVQSFYSYLAHNSLINHGRTFKLDITEIAAYFECQSRSVYRWIAELEGYGLIKVREHGNVVFEMPFVKLATNSAKAHGIDAQVKKDEEKLMKRCQAEIKAMEATLGRSLNDRERRAYISRRAAK